MLIPEVLYGTSRQVRQRMRKVVTQLRKGNTLPEVMESFDKIDLNDRPDALLWLGKFWAMQGGENFMILKLGEALVSDRRLDWEDVNRIRDESLEYLSSTPWGVLALNCPEQYYWVQDYPIDTTRFSRKGFVAVLNGIVKHWELYQSLGPRFFVGAVGGVRFSCCRPLAVYVLANGIFEKIDSMESLSLDIAEYCRKTRLIELLESDDAYWHNVCEQRRLKDADV